MMTLEDITLNNKMPRIFGTEYDNHIVFSYLDTIKSFYDSLSWCNIGGVETAAILSQSKVFSTIPYIYSSIGGTIESISVLLHNGRCNDAFTLVRKYCDSIILDVYKYILVEETEKNFQKDFSFEVIENNLVKKWIDSEDVLYDEKTAKEIYKKITLKHPQLTTLFNFKDKKALYHQLRNICNDNVHYNHFYNMMANDYEIIRAQKEIRNNFINNINKAIVLFFTMHYAFIYESNPTIFMSSDYMDCMECGVQPPQGSERWVIPCAQKAFNDIIKANKPSVAQYLLSLDLMDLE